MNKTFTKFLVVATLLFCGGGAQAQYYDWGQDPATVRWRTIKTPEVKFIFPDNFERQAVRLMHYMDTVRPSVGYGFDRGPMMRVPLILRTQNFSPNGIVMLAPKRMELLATPPADISAFPWLKQLAVHEYRHAVQYNNLNRGLVKVLSILLGQQGSLVGVGLTPMWAIEGDAVMAETQMSSFGRGLQPSFTIEYRAMAIEGTSAGYPVDKFFSGSYRDFIPDHYQLGYQMMSWADTYYGEPIIGKMTYFSARNPYLIFTTTLALRKYYKTGEGKLFSNAMGDAFAYWRSLPVADNTAEIIRTPIGSYTSYLSPRALTDGRIVAVKNDLAKTPRLVVVDPKTGDERRLKRIGKMNSGITVARGCVWWTETRQSTFWEQRVGSRLCSYDMVTGRKRAHRQRNVLFPAKLRDGSLAWVEYDMGGSYTVVAGEGRYPLPDNISVHGLAYDEVTDRLYFIGLDDPGMWIGSVGGAEQGFRRETEPSYATLSSLSAGGGALYYTSIASGKDEAHMYDLAERREYRITTSRYGSFAPSPAGGEIVMTTYTPDGYLLSRQSADRGAMTATEWSRLPLNIVNPPRRKWEGVMNIDEVVVAPTTDRPVKKYRKGTYLFNFHSWAPVCFEPDRLVSEGVFDMQLGATVMSQNHLNSTYSQLSYGWDGDFHTALAKFHYYGWAPKIEAQVEWSDRPRMITGNPNDLPRPAKRNSLEVSLFGYLPFRLSSGSMLRTLTPSVQWQYLNSALFNVRKNKYETGTHKAVFSLTYSENARMSHRDFLPRLGYSVRVRYTCDPLSDLLGRIWSFYGRAYLPGIGAHHSLMLRGNYQWQRTKYWTYSQKELLPRGARFDFSPRDYGVVSADYQLPLWCPDGGISSLIYFRRIRLNVGGDYARYTLFSDDRSWHTLWSYGADILLDVIPLRIPGNTVTTVKISAYAPSNRNGVRWGFGLTMPF
ncbi:hypothetical protein LJC45_02150 [Alistipes sp. OttesenSCG-928-B03]|nr:hypothetical protein [Alistipes sp. OttesenSCG-928-B03]